MSVRAHKRPKEYQKVGHYPYLDWYERPLGVPEEERYARPEVRPLAGMLSLWFPQVGKPGWAGLTLNQWAFLKYFEKEPFAIGDLPLVGTFYVPHKWGVSRWISVGEAEAEKLTCGCEGPVVVVEVANDTEIKKHWPTMHCIVHSAGMDGGLLTEMRDLDISGRHPGNALAAPVLLDGQEYDRLHSAGALVTPRTWQEWGPDGQSRIEFRAAEILGRFKDDDGQVRVWLDAEYPTDLISASYFIRRSDQVVAKINGFPGGVWESGGGRREAADFALKHMAVVGTSKKRIRTT